MTRNASAELAQHAQLRIDTFLPCYVCAPHSPRPRSTNGNIDGLHRHYLLGRAAQPLVGFEPEVPWLRQPSVRCGGSMTSLVHLGPEARPDQHERSRVSLDAGPSMTRHHERMERSPGNANDPVGLSVSAYTAVADAYEKAHAAKLSDRVKRFATSLAAPSLVLDAGCGPGRDMARFVAAGHVVRGVDLNPVFVAKASAYAPSFRFDLRQLGRRFPEEMFDGIWASASLVHLSHVDAVAVLQDFARLLRPGGRLFVSVRSTGESGWLDEPDGRRWYSVWTPQMIAAEVAAAGLRVDDIGQGPYTEVWAMR